MPQSPTELPLTEFPDLLSTLRRRHQSARSSGSSGRAPDSSASAPKPRVYVAGSSGEPTEMLNTLADQPEAAADLHFLQFPLPVLNQTDFTSLAPSAEQSVFFMTQALKNADPERLHYVPIHMRRVVDYLSHEGVDIALLQVARDIHGDLRIAANADFAETAAAAPATTVVAQLNEGFTAPLGAPVPKRLDYLVHGATDVPEFPVARASGHDAEVANAIGEHVASLIQDGDCLQTGIGAIPAAVLGALSDKADLGFHGGLIDDAVYALIESGVINGARKTLDAGVHIAGIVLGSVRLLNELSRRDDVLLVGAQRTHESSVIAQIDNFVSINSAVQVDLLGQVNGEYAAGKQLSGTGGSVDFMRSARGSRGGRSIVALPATARAGTVSRIVPRVDMVTALRTDVDLVVTEFGVADLRDQPLGERVNRLVSIAAPEFREQLQDGKP